MKNIIFAVIIGLISQNTFANEKNVELSIITNDIMAADGTSCGNKFGVTLNGGLIKVPMFATPDENWCHESFSDAYRVACNPSVLEEENPKQITFQFSNNKLILKCK